MKNYFKISLFFLAFVFAMFSSSLAKAQGCFLSGAGIAATGGWTPAFLNGKVEVYNSNCCKVVGQNYAWHWTVGEADVFWNSSYPMNDVVIDSGEGVTADIISATASTIRIRWKFNCPISNGLGYILIEMFPCGQDANRIVKLACTPPCLLTGWCVYDNCLQLTSTCKMCVTYRLNGNIYSQQINTGTTTICYGSSITSVEIISTTPGDCSGSSPGNLEPQSAPVQDIEYSNTALKSQIKSDSEFAVYPNPAKENIIFSFDLEESGIVKAYLTDISGKVVSKGYSGVLTKGKNNVNFELGNLPSGMYLAILEKNGKRMTQKLVIQK